MTQRNRRPVINEVSWCSVIPWSRVKCYGLEPQAPMVCRLHAPDSLKEWVDGNFPVVMSFMLLGEDDLLEVELEELVEPERLPSDALVSLKGLFGLTLTNEADKVDLATMVARAAIMTIARTADVEIMTESSGVEFTLSAGMLSATGVLPFDKIERWFKPED